MPERRLDAFRLARRHPLIGATLLAALGIVSLAIVDDEIGGIRGTGKAFWVAVAAYFLLATALVGFWLAWRRPVLLRIGPDGLELSPVFLRPFPWSDIRGLRYRVVRVGLFHRFRLLEVELECDAEIPVRWRIRWMAKLDRWYARKAGMRMALWVLEASAEEIIASAERFHPVRRMT